VTSPQAEGFRVRRLGRPDAQTLEALARYEREAFGETGLRSYDLNVVAYAGALYVGWLDGELVSCCQLIRTYDEPQAIWVIGFWVRPPWQRRGLGRALLTRVIDEMGTAGAASLLLTVEPDNQGALKLYRGFGFRRLDFIPDFYGPGEDRLLLRYDG
jgi:[ribosomal protein S18]-alanine N-acetyltransferase